jgi:hypothetical protein
MHKPQLAVRTYPPPDDGPRRGADGVTTTGGEVDPVKVVAATCCVQDEDGVGLRIPGRAQQLAWQVDADVD